MNIREAVYLRVDLIIKNVSIFNVYFKKFIKGNIAILNGRFLHTYTDDEIELEADKIIDGQGRYMIPGLIDIHMHIESSMTTPFQFVNAVKKFGVTTVVADPHEIANVFGIDGINEFINLDSNLPIDVFYGIPSSVPSTNNKLETTGGKITAEDVSKLIKNPKILCLGEVMNFKDLIEDDSSEINKIISIAKERHINTPIEGHCPKIQGLDLSRYLYAGVLGDHTQQNAESLNEKIANGMFIEIQEKSINKENVEYLMNNNLFEHFALVTDDSMADKLLNGHLDKLVRKVMEYGMSEEMAVYVATYTPARRMGLLDRGAIAPGKIADFILLDNIREFNIHSVYKSGTEIYKKGDFVYKNSISKFPEKYYNSIKLEKVTEEVFKIRLEEKNVKCRVIEVEEKSTFTREIIEAIEVRDGILDFENSDCAMIAVFNRYTGKNSPAIGLVKGPIIKEGAVATTWAHDHHNLMVMGKNIRDMTAAANRIIDIQGGYVVSKDEKIIAELELKIGGIISDERIDIIGDKLKTVRKALKSLGYNHNNQIMSFSTLSLPVSPEIKITDKGLIRVKAQEIVDLIVK